LAGLVLQGICKSLSGQVVIDDIDLTINEGELVCLLGPSGCGKTTTLRIVSGFMYPDAGRVLIGGADVTRLPPERRPTAMVFQNYALWPHMSVFDNVAFGLRLRKLGKNEVYARVEKILRMVNIWELRNRRPAQISGGEQQRVALARALVLEPKVLLLDEPLSNLDAKLRTEVRDEIREIQQRLGITSVFVTHDQDEALSIADRVAVLSGGRVQQFANPGEVYAWPASEFVGRFVGTMNFYRATVSGGMVRIEPAGPSVPCKEVLARADGEYVVGVRPEEVFLGPPGAGVPARLVRRIQRGHFAELVIELGGQLVRAYVPLSCDVQEPFDISFGRVLCYLGGKLEAVAQGLATPATAGSRRALGSLC
jgi:putative spermidine/putrescine transport system ATP-binding protein